MKLRRGYQIFSSLKWSPRSCHQILTCNGHSLIAGDRKRRCFGAQSSLRGSTFYSFEEMLHDFSTITNLSLDGNRNDRENKKDPSERNQSPLFFFSFGVDFFFCRFGPISIRMNAKKVRVDSESIRYQVSFFLKKIGI